MRLSKKNNLRILSLFFIVAGINHFIMPVFYLPLIPPYFPKPEVINVLAGLVEILLGIGLLYQKTRGYAGWGIVALMIAFIPSHWHFLQIGSCINESLCVPPWLAWARLILVHPILILCGIWAKKP
jgi:uncharacterized membrane protein